MSAAELSREPHVHLGPLAYRAGDLERAGQGEPRGKKAQISGVLVRSERVEKDNQALVEERDGLVDRIKERIARGRNGSIGSSGGRAPSWPKQHGNTIRPLARQSEVRRHARRSPHADPSVT